MRPFRYERPPTLAAAIGILEENGAMAAPLAGGTDLIIGLRDGSARPEVVVDLKGIDEIEAGIHRDGDSLVIGGRAVMEDIARDARVRATSRPSPRRRPSSGRSRSGTARPWPATSATPRRRRTRRRRSSSTAPR